MHLTIIHDTHGNIQAVIAHQGDVPAAHMELKPGQLVAQVNMDDLDVDADQEAVHTHLTNIRQNYKVEVEASTSRLTRKPGS
jgi:hypothetical protein